MTNCKLLYCINRSFIRVSGIDFSSIQVPGGPARRNRQPNQNVASALANAAGLPALPDPGALRQMLLADPNAATRLRERNPDLADAINDPGTYRYLRSHSSLAGSLTPFAFSRSVRSSVQRTNVIPSSGRSSTSPNAPRQPVRPGSPTYDRRGDPVSCTSLAVICSDTDYRSYVSDNKKSKATWRQLWNICPKHLAW